MAKDSLRSSRMAFFTTPEHSFSPIGVLLGQFIPEAGSTVNTKLQDFLMAGTADSSGLRVGGYVAALGG
jgi:hypothetical protein